jgi:hypothetical protein
MRTGPRERNDEEFMIPFFRVLFKKRARETPKKVCFQFLFCSSYINYHRERVCFGFQSVDGNATPYGAEEIHVLIINATTVLCFIACDYGIWFLSCCLLTVEISLFANYFSIGSLIIITFIFIFFFHCSFLSQPFFCHIRERFVVFRRV